MEKIIFRIIAKDINKTANIVVTLNNNLSAPSLPKAEASEELPAKQIPYPSFA